MDEVNEAKYLPRLRDVYLNNVFHKLTLPELEQFAPNSEREENKNDPRCKLLQEYYAKCAVLSPPGEKAYNSPYQYDVFDLDRLNFFREMIAQHKDFNPAEINLEYYKLIGTETETDTVIVFNPLLFLQTCGNQVLLNRIYDYARENYKSLESFGFQVGAPLRGALIFYKYGAEEREIILRHFVKAQWAICTYQSIEEFETHYRQMLSQIDETHIDLIDEINKKFLDYARKTYNQTLVNHLALHEDHDILRKTGHPILVSRMINHGLNVKIALRHGKTPAVKLLLIESGANALDLLDTQTPDWEKSKASENIVLHMLYRHSQNTPDEKDEITVLAKAIKDKTTFFKLDDAKRTSTLGKIAVLAEPFLKSPHL